MTLRILSIFLSCLTCNVSHAQAKNHARTISTTKKDGYLYIPEAIFSDSVDALLFQDITLDKTKDNKTITMSWDSNCNDGSFCIVVTPEQIYFIEAHNNPNPNFIYWIQSIDSSVYLEIKKGLANKTPSGFSTNHKRFKSSETIYFNNEFKDSIQLKGEDWDAFHLVCRKQIKSQVVKFYSILNSYIKVENNRVAIPSDEMMRNKLKYIAGSLDELNW